jgi:hypothetical protein
LGNIPGAGIALRLPSDHIGTDLTIVVAVMAA